MAFVLSAIFHLLSSLPASADLQITGTPGFTFSDTAAGRPTVANLNRALRFTYLVSGTIGGTNAGLAAGSINASHLASSVGGSNIVVTSGGLVVSNNGVGPNQLSTAAAGAGLGGGGGSALHILCDSNTIVNTGDIISVGVISNVNVAAGAAVAVSKLAFSTNTVVASSAFGTNALLGFNSYFTATSSNTFEPLRFATSETALGSGTTLNVAHGLGSTPEIVRFVLVCKTSESGFAVGDEVDIHAFSRDAGSRPAFSVGGNSTNIFCTQGDTALIRVSGKADGTIGSAITPGSWRIKGYARK